jgi:exopolysaccharide biosynthesis polyprenyl glycosylphosphotransferase
MRVFRRRILVAMFQIFDLSLMLVAFLFATTPVLITQGPVSFAEFFDARIKITNGVLFCLLLLAWNIIFSSFGLYQSKRITNRQSEISEVLKADALATFALYVAGVLLRIEMMTPSFLFIFWFSVSLLTVGSRILLKYLLTNLRIHGRNLRHVLIVGANKRALEFSKMLERHRELGYKIIGFADEEWAGTAELRGQGLQIVCGLDDFSQYLRSSIVDEVVIALPIRSLYAQASQIATLSQEQGINTRLIGGVFDIKLAQSRPEEYEGESVITLYMGMSDGWPLVVKRVFDILSAMLLLAVLSPLFLIVTLLIRFTSPGPVFFLQDRVGLNKRRFRMCKFRTMVPNAEKRLAELESLNEVSGPVFKIKNDPRITPLGRFLRKTSLDELPQLFNVLRGDMSLVGPRPLPLRDYEGFDQDWQRRRFSVRPGITCLWQISGRSSISFEKWMELDMQYIDKWSLWLDLKILVRTIPAVLGGSGAA